MKARNMLALTLAGVMTLGMAAGCSSGGSGNGGGAKDSANSGAASTETTAQAEKGDSKESAGGSGEVVEITFPSMWVGVNTFKEWFEDRMEVFNAEYGDSIKVNIEEIAGDQNYVDKIKVLYSSDSLPDAFCTGGYNLIDTMQDKLVDLTPYIDDEWKKMGTDVSWEVNSRDGKIYGIPYARQAIGYFYNKDLFAQAGIEKPAETWDEFFEQCDKLLAAGITPLSMDTADSGWVTSLMLGAMIGQTDAGEEFMNTNLPKDYNTPEFIEAAGNIQRMFQNYTTSDAVGGAYENAAGNFFTEETAIIANGPWMVSDFYDTNMVEEGFADKIGTAMYPGGVMYNSGKIGFNIGSKDEKALEATLTFVKFLTNEESQKLMLEITGDIPAADGITSDKTAPLVNEVIENAGKASHSINDFQSLWYANVVDEISIQYPLLAQGEITPEQFAQALTDAAAKN